MAGCVAIILGVTWLALQPEQQRPPPQPVHSRYFHVSADDVAKYKVFEFNRSLVLHAMLSRHPRKDGWENMAIARIEKIPRASIFTPIKPVCDGVLRTASAHFRPDDRSTWGRLNPAGHLSAYDYFVTPAGDVAIRCFVERSTCTAIFDNDTWSADIILMRGDLCDAVGINERLRGLVQPWLISRPPASDVPALH
jgi:hypothetical protein